MSRPPRAQTQQWHLEVTTPDGKVYSRHGDRFYGLVDEIAEEISADRFPDRDIFGGMN